MRIFAFYVWNSSPYWSHLPMNGAQGLLTEQSANWKFINKLTTISNFCPVLRQPRPGLHDTQLYRWPKLNPRQGNRHLLSSVLPPTMFSIILLKVSLWDKQQIRRQKSSLPQVWLKCSPVHFRVLFSTRADQTSWPTLISILEPAGSKLKVKTKIFVGILTDENPADLCWTRWTFLGIEKAGNSYPSRISRKGPVMRPTCYWRLLLCRPLLSPPIPGLPAVRINTVPNKKVIFVKRSKFPENP